MAAPAGHPTLPGAADAAVAAARQPQSRLRAEIVRVAAALADYPVREDGPNRGRAVEAVLRFAGGAAGQPWCCAFVDYVYETACLLTGAEPVLDCGLSCSRLVARASRLGLLISDPLSAQPGDILVLRGGPTGYCHVGVVAAAADARGRILSIEGNTRPQSGSGAEGVYRRLRSVTAASAVAISVG